MKKLNMKKVNHQEKNTTKKGWLLMFTCMILSISLMAKSPLSTFSLTAKNHESLVLQLPENMESYTVSIFDLTGGSLHQEVLPGTILTREYKLNQLPSGEYIFEISFDRTKKWKHIEIVNGTLQGVEQDFQMIVEPTVLLNERFLDLNMLCFSNSKVNVSILDDNGQLLRQDDLIANGTIAQRYNLKNLKEGEYQLYVSSTDPLIDFEYSKTIELTDQNDNESHQYAEK